MSQRWGFYLMTVACLGVLAGIYAGRGQTWWAVGFALLAGAYLTRGAILQMRENRDHREDVIEAMAERKTSAEKRVILQNLLDTRKQLRGRRSAEILLGMLVLVGVVFVYPANPTFAWVLSALFIPLGFLIIKHTRSIILIERGLAERGLLPRR